MWDRKVDSPVVVEKKPGPHRPGMHVELELAPVVLLEQHESFTYRGAPINWPQDRAEVSIGT